jgi:hypothetical protein
MVASESTTKASAKGPKSSEAASEATAKPCPKVLVKLIILIIIHLLLLLPSRLSLLLLLLLLPSGSSTCCPSSHLLVSLAKHAPAERSKYIIVVEEPGERIPSAEEIPKYVLRMTERERSATRSSREREPSARPE